MKILFMGTPAFACVSLQALTNAGHEIAGVFTRADAPQGRGMKLIPPPVKTLALALGIPVHQPVKLRDGTALSLIRGIAPDLIAVVAYGRLLPEDILISAPRGCVNVHGSLLPKYRGAAPIQWAIAHGETETGVTTQHMARGMDEGDMIFSDRTPILPRDTAGSLHDRLMDMGARLLVRTVEALERGHAPRVPQNENEATYAPPVTREHARIDWTRSAAALDCHIRAFHPWPVAHTAAGGAVLRIHAAEPADRGIADEPGSVFFSEEGGLFVSCGEGSLHITLLQAQGGKPMRPQEFLRGHTLPPRLGT